MSTPTTKAAHATQPKTASVFADPDPRLVALNRFRVPTIRRRLETVRLQLTLALGALHSATAFDDLGGSAIPGTCIGTDAMCAAAYKALADAFQETEWLNELPDLVLDGHAPDCDQREDLEAAGFGDYDHVRDASISEARRLAALYPKSKEAAR